MASKGKQPRNPNGQFRKPNGIDKAKRAVSAGARIVRRMRRSR